MRGVRLLRSGLLMTCLLVVSLAPSSAQAQARGKEFPVPTPSSFPSVIALGPDGAPWFTELLGNNVGRITSGGTITEFPIPTPSSRPQGIAAGPDGAMW